MEENKKLKGSIFIPSLFILLVIVSSIMIFYSLYIDAGVKISGSRKYFSAMMILTISIIILPFIYKNSIKNTGKIKILFVNMPFSYGTFNSFILLAVTVLLVILLHKSITETLTSPVYSGTGIYSGEIESIKFRRYDNQIVMKFKNSEDEQSMHVKAKSMYMNGICFLKHDLKIEKGDRIIFRGKIKRISAGDRLTPYSRWLLMRGIHYFINIREIRQVIKEENYNIRFKARGWIKKNIRKFFSDNTSKLLLALYLGNKNYMGKDICKNYKRAGVLHVLAASGLHVGVIGCIPLLILGFIRVNRNFAYLASFLLILCYTLLTDMPVSLIRATLMFGIFVIQQFTGCEKNILNTLFITAVIILFLYPYELYNPGFQLSFGATLGIILFYKCYRETFSYLPKPLSGSIALTLSTQIIVLPLILMHMGELNLSGIISNVVVVPMTGIVLAASLLVNLASLISIETAKFLGKITDFIYYLKSSFVNMISEFNGHFIIDHVELLHIIFFLALLLPLLPFIKRKRFTSPAVIISFAAAWALLGAGNAVTDKSIKFLNHKSGTTLLIRSKDKASMIGVLPGIAETKKLLNIVDRDSIKSLDLYITSPDFYNIKSYSYLIKKSTVTACYLSSDFFFSDYMSEFFKLIDMEGIELKIVNYKKEGITDINHLNADILRENPGSITDIVSAYSLTLTSKSETDFKNIEISELSI